MHKRKHLEEEAGEQKMKFEVGLNLLEHLKVEKLRELLPWIDHTSKYEDVVIIPLIQNEASSNSVTLLPDFPNK